MDPHDRQVEYLTNAITNVEDRMIDPREFGQLQGEVKSLRTDMDRMMGDIGDIKKAIHEISGQLSEAKGGWRVMMMVGGAGASLGGLVSWFVTHVKLTP